MTSEYPTEILSKILSYLPLKDVLHLSCVSSNFCDASALVYTRRRNQIRGQYSSCQIGSSLSFYEVRHLLLLKYGFTVGLWKIVSTPYGGLLEVKFDGYQLVGTRFFPPPDRRLTLDAQLRPHKVFIVNIDDEGQCECICFRGHNVPHPAEIVQFDGDGFQLNCCNSEIHQHLGGFQQAFDHWLKEELDVAIVDETLRTELHTSKFDTLSKEVSVQCRPLQLPQSQESVIVQPGLFKGSYSAHGLELVMLTYDNDGKTAVLTKITGDPNIPAGKVSIVADLLTAPKEDFEENNTDSDVSEDEPESPVFSASGLPLQRFILPSFIALGLQAVPKYYAYRFASEGQVAETGYENAQFVSGQWVIFDGDTFGHVWVFLGAFAMFKRVTETFCT